MNEENCDNFIFEFFMQAAGDFNIISKRMAASQNKECN